MIYLAAILIVTGVALFVAAPLTGESLWRRAARPSAEVERLEHERELAMQGLRELEFDREMGKLSEFDYAALKTPLEERALAAMGALGRSRNEPGSGGAPVTAPVVRTLRAVVSPSGGAATARKVRFCPECGSAVGGNYKFCAGCGAPLAALRRAGGEAG